MSVQGVYQNIENVLQRIEEIKTRFAPFHYQRFHQILQERMKAVGKEETEIPKALNTTQPDNTTKTKYDNIIEAAAERFRIPAALIKAVIKQESNFNPTAVSQKGAMGLMQLMPATAEGLNVRNPFNPDENIFAGTSYLVDLINRYNGNLNRALAAYNAGPHRVQDRIPMIPETRDFIDSVLYYYETFSKFKNDEE